MTMKSSLKLTAVSVGIATLAFTACKDKSNDNTTPVDQSSKKDESKPQPIKNLKVKFNGEIPEGACSTYTITYTDENGKEADMTNHAKKAGSLSVNLDTATANSKKFKLKDETNEVCANAEDTFVTDTESKDSKSEYYGIPVDTQVKAKAVKGNPVGINVRSEGFFISADTKVSDKVVVKDFSIYNTLKLNKEGEVDISSTTNIEASLGKYAKFAVLLNNSNNTKNILSDLKQVTVATKDNKNLNIISEVEESITYFKFLIPNDLNIGDYKFKVKVAGITKTLLVKVQKAKLEEIIKLKNSKEEKTINDLDVLKVNTSYFGNILAKYSNTDFFDITNTRHKNYSESAPTNIYKIRLASTSSSNIDFKLANNDADAFDNPLEIIAKVATDLDPVTLNLDIKDAADEYLTIAKKLYVGNKPKIESTVFQINSADAPNIKIAHGVDSTNKAKVSNGCATLSSVTYSLGGVSKPAVTDSSKFKVVLPEAEKGKEPLKEFIFDRVKFICSTASAKANQSYKVFVQASQDETVSKEVTFTVGDAVNTTDYIVSIDGNNKALGDDIILQLKAAGEDAFSNVITAHLLKSDSTVVSEGIISDDLAATFEFDNPAFSIVRDDTNKSNYRIKLTKAAIASAKGSPIVATMTLKQLTGHKLNVDRKNIRIVFTK